MLPYVFTFTDSFKAGDGNTSNVEISIPCSVSDLEMESHGGAKNSRNPSQLINDYLQGHSDIFQELQVLRKKVRVNDLLKFRLTHRGRDGQMSRPTDTSRSNASELTRPGRLSVDYFLT
jgi:hypothetical protein